ncbi:hypothetical protein [Actinomadura welshii]|uniref:hypothetical protein n=1 Tax=Actinomadura welshii TaxID=3103817 RepID=UPI00040BE5D2|nr:hypothetical protein [Actinomadura madurae]
MNDFGFRVCGLSLHGYRKDYTVSFTDSNADVFPLSIIAGEISTGKSSILELVDYCLGATRFPEHIEVVQSVRSVRLEILAFEPIQIQPDQSIANSIPGEPSSNDDAVRWRHESVNYVIERSIEGTGKSALLYRGTLNNFGGLPRVLSPDSSAEDSISKFLLQLCDLDGIRLRQAPKKSDSPTHALSFRDLRPLWFLTNTRLDNKNLALEHNPHVAIKLRQVIDLTFNVYDETGAALAQQINELRRELTVERTGVTALRKFLGEQGVTGPIELEERESEISRRVHGARQDLEALDQRLTERTSFAASLREEYLQRAQEAREAGARLRDRETLLRRLVPLRAQYAEDIKKLTLLVEARKIFDPLSVKVCPACATDLKRHVSIIDGRCSLCNSHVIAAGVTESNGQDSALSVGNGEPVADDHSTEIDVSRELSSTKRRLSELKEYIESVEREVREARSRSEFADTAALELQRRLDEMTEEAVTPFISQRDRLSASLSALESQRSEIEQQRRMLLSFEKRTEGVERRAGRLSEMERMLRDLETERRNRDQVLVALTERFSRILRDFGFPKLSGAFIDKMFIPHVRELRYDRVGSSGAMTLIALAWELTLFEVAFEEGGRHPGFLMIDSPQKNLAPESQPGTADSGLSAANVGLIVNRVYSHILTWLSEEGAGAQVIVVDNVPPTAVDSSVVVRYSGDENRPPYGLIDDAVNI